MFLEKINNIRAGLVSLVQHPSWQGLKPAFNPLSAVVAAVPDAAETYILYLTYRLCAAMH